MIVSTSGGSKSQYLEGQEPVRDNDLRDIRQSDGLGD